MPFALLIQDTHHPQSSNMLVLVTGSCLAAFALYLWHVNRAISTTPEEAVKLRQKPWTTKQIEEAYEKAQISPTDVTPYLFSKKSRRYVVVGGSGKLFVLQYYLAAHSYRARRRMDRAASAAQR